MKYLYHRVPKNMSGTILYPLNTLKINSPEIYNDQVKKYEGREKLLEIEIPPLKCLWNDVIHLTAVHPDVLKTNLTKIGMEYSMSFFEIPVGMVFGPNSIAFTYRRDIDLMPKFRDYEPFNPDRMDIYSTVPEETIKYYFDMKEKGQRPLLYHMVPHILYKGNIETKDLNIISV